MPSDRDRLDRRRVTALGGDRRVYRAGGDGEETSSYRRSARTSSREDRPLGERRRQHRSPALALAVIVAIVVVIVVVGLAARDGGLSGPQGQTGTFKLLPITTTTTTS